MSLPSPVPSVSSESRPRSLPKRLGVAPPGKVRVGVSGRCGRGSLPTPRSLPTPSPGRSRVHLAPRHCRKPPRRLPRLRRTAISGRPRVPRCARTGRWPPGSGGGPRRRRPGRLTAGGDGRRRPSGGGRARGRPRATSSASPWRAGA